MADLQEASVSSLLDLFTTNSEQEASVLQHVTDTVHDAAELSSGMLFMSVYRSLEKFATDIREPMIQAIAEGADKLLFNKMMSVNHCIYFYCHYAHTYLQINLYIPPKIV